MRQAGRDDWEGRSGKEDLQGRESPYRSTAAMGPLAGDGKARIVFGRGQTVHASLCQQFGPRGLAGQAESVQIDSREGTVGRGRRGQDRVWQGTHGTRGFVSVKGQTVHASLCQQFHN